MVVAPVIAVGCSSCITYYDKLTLTAYVFEYEKTENIYKSTDSKQIFIELHLFLMMYLFTS